MNNMNMQALMRQAENLQKEMQKAQEEIEKEIFYGENTFFKVEINGKKEILSVKIDAKDGLEKDDIEALEDMILLAFNEAFKKVDKFKDEKMGKFSNVPGLF